MTTPTIHTNALTVPGELDSLGAIADFVIAAAATAGREKKATYRFRLAVDEVATNIILHGYEEAGYSGNVELSVTIDDQALTLAIEDTGIPYDPNRYDLPDADDLQQPIEQRPLGGLGVLLAIQGVDRFMYERSNDRNRNIFVVNRPTKQP
jgi:anti-sigma regulatory factor (Ser/Thr protein kinase)